MKNFKNVEFIIYDGLVLFYEHCFSWISLWFVTFYLYKQCISTFGIFFVLYVLKFEIKRQKVPTLNGIPGSTLAWISTWASQRQPPHGQLYYRARPKTTTSPHHHQPSHISVERERERAVEQNYVFCYALWLKNVLVLRLF